ncbi:MAG TPA: MBL fold metallo-hydrolase, partial [Rhizobacter sp.]|nr:MBL fold metallo-hydrolase [Rhizobacter sp.]
MTPADEHYEVYAIRYASMPRRRSQNFLPPDAHDGPMPMDFFVWLIKSGARSILVDTGFSAATGLERERNFLRCPIQALVALGVAPGQVHDVVLTHLHYDHAG